MKKLHVIILLLTAFVISAYSNNVLIKIEGPDGVFNKSTLQKTVFGHIGLGKSMVEDLGNLEYLGSGLLLTSTKIKSLKNLKEINGNLHIDVNCALEDLGELTKVTDIIYMDSFKIKSSTDLLVLLIYLWLEFPAYTPVGIYYEI